ncbi:hypothetical protein BC89_02095 [Pseudomonas monteilii]|nr:hypothetical protein BC89_02095 [Pseudomonas monteilii]
MQQLTEVGQPLASTVRIGFLLSEGFDFYALAAALEPLRIANEVARCEVCQWQIISLGGRPLKASNGISTATVELSQAKPLDILIVCPGDEMRSHTGTQHLRHRVSGPKVRCAAKQMTWWLPTVDDHADLPVGQIKCVHAPASVSEQVKKTLALFPPSTSHLLEVSELATLIGVSRQLLERLFAHRPH